MIDFQFIDTKIIQLKNSNDWLQKVITTEKKQLGEIVFVFCKDAYLLEKNIQFLKHETLTDVITFDYCEGNQISGDILISVERVKENSEIFEVTFLNELDRVMVHGLLHLLGYKDKTKEDTTLIRSKEDFYLSIK
ncbi:MAG: rRNA maturation factor [Cryomorphaceae bacterium BACL11 MAG-121015-bin20]|jgi:probable rRNA maturation factor|nr:MAG: rRNA maturation factor [Cryomorphaceae bacterium BACL11 MAG-121015-bin20]